MIFGTIGLTWFLAFATCCFVHLLIAPKSLNGLVVAGESFFITLVFLIFPMILFLLMFRPTVQGFSKFVIGSIVCMLIFIIFIYSILVLASIA